MSTKGQHRLRRSKTDLIRTYPSVIKHDYSYGGKSGLWDLAVLDNMGQVDSTTQITNDVIGHLTWERVEKYLERVKLL